MSGNDGPSAPSDSSATAAAPTNVTNFMDDWLNEDIDLAAISSGLKPRSSLHLKRKLVHALYGLTFACVLNRIDVNAFTAVGSTCSLGLLTVELLRYIPGFRWINNFFYFLFGGVLRKSEMSGRLTGSFYYFAGVTLTAKMFDRVPAILGIVQLAIADPTASLCGR